MKTKHLLVIASLALLVVSSGCNKILKEDPKANLTTDSYPKTQSDLDAWVNGMYVTLARHKGHSIVPSYYR